MDYFLHSVVNTNIIYAHSLYAEEICLEGLESFKFIKTVLHVISLGRTTFDPLHDLT